MRWFSHLAPYIEDGPIHGLVRFGPNFNEGVRVRALILIYVRVSSHLYCFGSIPLAESRLGLHIWGESWRDHRRKQKAPSTEDMGGWGHRLCFRHQNYPPPWPSRTAVTAALNTCTQMDLNVTLLLVQSDGDPLLKFCTQRVGKIRDACNVIPHTISRADLTGFAPTIVLRGENKSEKMSTTYN
ncbi:hypothetical protein PIB30_091535 [Stylosanthes scabra]|uniref:Uncharacterized protein n=1 Tax=Stylosanthes scabra TaxID=79078 RepID=A0ABU6XWD6_9FABA|nr:hypothetical protein [Stylosanthes scabra]